MEIRYEEIVAPYYSRIREMFSESALKEFCEAPPEKVKGFDVGVGTMIRLKLLRPNHTLYKRFIRVGITDTKEMTGIALDCFYRYMVGEEATPDAQHPGEQGGSDET